MSPLARLDWLLAVAGDKHLPPSALAVAVALAKFVNIKTGDARPAKDTLADLIRTDERAVRRMVLALESAGWLVVTRSKGRACCTYRPVQPRPAGQGSTPGTHARVGRSQPGHRHPGSNHDNPSPNPGTVTRVEPGQGNPGEINPGEINPGRGTRVAVPSQPGSGDAANPGTVTTRTGYEQGIEQGGRGEHPPPPISSNGEEDTGPEPQGTVQVPSRSDQDPEPSKSQEDPEPAQEGTAQEQEDPGTKAKRVAQRLEELRRILQAQGMASSPDAVDEWSAVFGKGGACHARSMDEVRIALRMFATWGRTNGTPVRFVRQAVAHFGKWNTEKHFHLHQDQEGAP